jgi:hypothetical protein
LVAELERLRAQLTQCLDRGAVEICGRSAAAKEAAEREDRGSVTQHLLEAGRWALDVATRLGLPVAEAALKQGLGIGS